ncbi:endonuclease domain-containing protein [Enteroscipio rubneri]|uniref:endonuclease domain-containing protein n=1 Tax=Enteroscipio rubneri TaxID=2070686 RepID=UPI003208D7E7
MGFTRRQELAQRANTMRNNQTYYERLLWLHFLRTYPISFVPQKVIGNYIVDFYCRKARLSIELDGDSHYSIRQREYDRVRTTFLEVLEIKEQRFTNTEVVDNFEGVCEAIHIEVQRRRNDVLTQENCFQNLKTR